MHVIVPSVPGGPPSVSGVSTAESQISSQGSSSSGVSSIGNEFLFIVNMMFTGFNVLLAFD